MVLKIHTVHLSQSCKTRLGAPQAIIHSLAFITDMPASVHQTLTQRKSKGEDFCGWNANKSALIFLGENVLNKSSDFCKKEEYTQNSTHFPDRTLRNYNEILFDTMIFEIFKWTDNTNVTLRG